MEPEQSPDWDYFSLKDPPLFSQLFRVWAHRGIQEKYQDGRWIPAKIPVGYCWGYGFELRKISKDEALERMDCLDEKPGENGSGRGYPPNAALLLF